MIGAAAPGADALTLRIHDLPQARIAIEIAAELELELRLASAAHAAGYAGVAYWAAVQAALARPVIVDCDDLAGLVMSGLRLGLRELVYSGEAEILAKLHGMAVQLGGRVLGRLPEPVLALPPTIDRRDLRALLAALVPPDGRV